MLLQFEGPECNGWVANPLYEVKKNHFLSEGYEIFRIESGTNLLLDTYWASLQALIDSAYSHGFRLIADYKTHNELHMRYNVTIPNNSAKFKYETCDHEYVDYIGFIEQFTYCKKCDVRK